MGREKEKFTFPLLRHMKFLAEKSQVLEMFCWEAKQ